MNGYFRNPIVSGITFVALTAAFFYFLHTPDSKMQDPDRFLGTWTDPHGAPGNYIRFGQKKIDLPNNPVPLLTAYEGRATFHKHFDQEETTVLWNFESTENLRLNVTVPGKCSFAAIRMIDADRMLVRFAKTIGEASADDVFDGPEVKALVRVREAKPAAE